ncbi:Quinone oxidoreductase 2 [Planctomycetes bacterium Pan216]|uniref:Quinone oxidoreductase 2 n=1 Tax=Kolteria novifilia TaxID=2527975 RepID=A0A518B327_9BACT|nr:Quinone oxidoreductase 2 [Planctomycetes bacterium Pan216]
MTDQPIALTGVTGSLGANIARCLATSGRTPRLIVRDAGRAPALSHADVREASYQDTNAFAKAVEGCESVFLVSLPESAERRSQHRSAVDACQQAGVKRIVYTSFINTAPDATFTLSHDHYHTEQALEASGIPFVALRNSFYLEMVPALVTDGVIRGPGGSGKIAPVARTDVATVAAAVLMDGFEETLRLDVTGPELLDLHEIARIIAEITGEPVRYDEETIDQAYASRRHLNATQLELDAWVSTYTALAKGEFAVLSETVKKITGRPARAPREYLSRLLDKTRP